MMPPHHPPINFSATLRQPRTTKLDIQGELNLLIIADPPKQLDHPTSNHSYMLSKNIHFGSFGDTPSRIHIIEVCMKMLRFIGSKTKNAGHFGDVVKTTSPPVFKTAVTWSN